MIKNKKQICFVCDSKGYVTKLESLIKIYRLHLFAFEVFVPCLFCCERKHPVFYESPLIEEKLQ